MPLQRSPDFDHIFQKFVEIFGEDEAAFWYDRWLTDYGFDDTVAFGPQVGDPRLSLDELKESFSWTLPVQLYSIEDSGTKLYKVLALHVGRTGNRNKYTDAELREAARSLAERPLDLNHFKPLPQSNRVVDANYEGGAVEAIIAIADPFIPVLIASGKIKHVSIEAKFRDATCDPSGCEAHGIVFTGLALLTEGVEPGDPVTKICLFEKKVSSIMVTPQARTRKSNSAQPLGAVTKEKERMATKANPPSPPPAVLAVGEKKQCEREREERMKEAEKEKEIEEKSKEASEDKGQTPPAQTGEIEESKTRTTSPPAPPVLGKERQPEEGEDVDEKIASKVNELVEAKLKSLTPPGKKEPPVGKGLFPADSGSQPPKKDWRVELAGKLKEAIDNTAAAAAIPEIWAPQIEVLTAGKAVMRNLVLVDDTLQGTPGKILHYPRLGTVTAVALTEGTAPAEAGPTIDKLDITVNEVGAFQKVNWNVLEDITGNIVDALSQAFAEALALKEDADSLANFDAVGNFAATVFGGSAASEGALVAADKLTPAKIADAITEMRKLGQVARWLVIHPAQENNLLKDSQFTNAATYGDQSVVVNGEIGSYLGVRVVTSVKAPTGTGSGAITTYHAFVIGERAQVMASKRRVEVRSEDHIDVRQTWYTATERYGFGVLIKNRNVRIITA